MDSTFTSLTGPLHYFADINFLHFAIFLFAVCVAILVGVSLLTRPPPDAQLNGLTYSTTMASDREASRATWNKLDVIHSVIIVALILGILFCFSPLGFG